MNLEEKLFRENIELSSLNKRVLAFTIDELILSVIFIAAFADKVAMAKSMEESIVIINSLVGYMLVLKVVYHGFFTFMYGKTVGKMIMKIRVIDAYTLDKPDIAKSFIRAGIRVISEAFFYIGFLFAYFTPFRQTLHDKVSKVIIVND
jgi:uncharacterized RDD family membrane protein YckC